VGNDAPHCHSSAVVTVGGRLWAVFVVAFVVRLAWVMTLGPALVWPDEEEFVGIAKHLAAGDGYVSVSYRANPVLPAYLAAVFVAFGESYRAARVGQALMGALTCVLVAATGMRLLGVAVGTIAGLMLAVYLPHVYLSGVFYAECLFTLLIACTVYGAVRSLDTNRPLPWLAATGVSFALTALSRPIFLAYLPFLLAAIFYASRAAFSRKVLMATILVVATVLGILPWTIRNYLVLGRPVLVSTGFGTKLWQGNNEGAAGDADDRELSFRQDVWRARVATLPEPERTTVEARYRDAERRIDALQAASGDAYTATDAVLGPLAWEHIRTHPLRTVELFVRKLGTLFLPFSKTLVTNEHTTSLNQWLAALAYVPILVLAAVGIWFSAGRHPGLWMLYGLLVSVSAAYGVLTACTRFRLPLDPYLVVFAAAAVVELWARRRREIGNEAPRLSSYASRPAAM
jgi:4-amino-4-deoxy-L-arabinose transferase-like glycosyltransferase